MHDCLVRVFLDCDEGVCVYLSAGHAVGEQLMQMRPSKTKT